MPMAKVLDWNTSVTLHNILRVVSGLILVLYPDPTLAAAGGLHHRYAKVGLYSILIAYLGYPLFA